MVAASLIVGCMPTLNCGREIAISGNSRGTLSILAAVRSIDTNHAHGKTPCRIDLRGTLHTMLADYVILQPCPGNIHILSNPPDVVEYNKK
jgi:hypothetical protein